MTFVTGREGARGRSRAGRRDRSPWLGRWPGAGRVACRWPRGLPLPAGSCWLGRPLGEHARAWGPGGRDGQEPARDVLRVRRGGCRLAWAGRLPRGRRPGVPADAAGPAAGRPGLGGGGWGRRPWWRRRRRVPSTRRPG